MKLHLGFIVGMFLMSCVSFVDVDGQVNKKTPVGPKPKVEATPKPQAPIMVEKATTETGKFVLLKSDGTWEYDKEPRPIVVLPSPPVSTTGILHFKAAVVTRGGTVIPVARGDFELLDEDLRITLASKVAEKIKAGDFAPYLTSMDYDLIKLHVVAKSKSDFEGNGTFPPMEVKTYFVYFFGFVGQNSIAWSLKVDIKPGDNYIVLDQNNALETFSR